MSKKVLLSEETMMSGLSEENSNSFFTTPFSISMQKEACKSVNVNRIVFVKDANIALFEGNSSLSKILDNAFITSSFEANLSLNG